MRQRIVTAVTRPEFWLLGLLFWLLLSAGRSLGTPWARVALTEALRWSAGIGLALALGAFFRHTKIAARFVVTLAGAIALLGIADGLHPGGGGLTGPFRDHQLYGSVLLLLLPPVVAVALTTRDTRWRLGSVAAAGGGALCLALSQTRSAWAGALAAALVFGCLWLFRSGSRRRAARALLLAAAALAGAGLVLWLLLTPMDLSAPMTARVGTLSALDKDKSWQERLTLWRGASRLAAAYPVAGIGLGRYPGAQWAWTRAGSPLSPSERPSLSEEAHDFYLQTAAETGLVGLGLYVAALAAFVCLGLGQLRRTRIPQVATSQTGISQTRRHRSHGRDALVIASLSVVAGQAVDALASPSWQFGEASLLFWALLGVGLAAMRGEEPEPAAVPIPRPMLRAGRLALSGGVAVALAANVLPLGLLTPVEAYTPPTGWTYVFGTLVISGPATVIAGTTVPYTLTATYSDASAHQHSVDVTLDPYAGDISPTLPANYATMRVDNTTASSTFGAANTSSRNRLTAATGDIGRPINVTGRFYDHVGLHASQALRVTVN